jgi:hypothetical protein
MTIEKRNVVEPELTVCDKCCEKAIKVTPEEALCSEHAEPPTNKEGSVATPKLKSITLEDEIDA